MALTETTGDLLASDATLLICPTNTVGVMGAGVAKAFRDRWPAMFAAWRAECAAGRFGTGQLWTWTEPGTLFDTGTTIGCVATKRHWRDPSRFVDVAAAIGAIAEWSAAHPEASVAVPALGCGLGGLPWPQVRDAMRAALGPLGTDIRLHAPR